MSTVVLHTIDHGPVEFECPAWCIGHHWQMGRDIGRNDITHNSARVKAVAQTEARGLVPVLACRISWAPFAELVPVVDVEVDVQSSFPAEDIAHVARGLRTAAMRLERMAGEAIRMRGEIR
ncbi:DUF6907 domain-containing protein [Streptomyces sp. NBC_00582]|uniref:DUF6907 domain-containing protein n=1 Tax=Streptomyces sp. NBC_00582 TaxID=2975783 RepID=UPI002E81A35D|nr:hypothetical protein [Streptomyces sp. NBC_00582]WUB60452.1 hypothetical protein OG852_08670 [Streptomyces sp. NBC_00582]